MLPFDLERVLDLASALAYLSERGDCTRVLAGGTDLLIELRKAHGGDDRTRYVLDISDVHELRFIRAEGDDIVLGPLTTFADIVRSSLLAPEAPLLIEAATQVGSPQIRVRGTLGGNIATASPSADGVCALVALDAQVCLAGQSDSSWSPLDSVVCGPHRTTLAPDRLIVGIRFPRLRGHTGTAFTKLARRNALGISRINVAVVLRRGVARVQDARVVVGAALPAPLRLPAVEACLIGESITAAVCREAGSIAAACVMNITGRRWSSEYKLPVLERLVARTITNAWDSAGECHADT